jgi:hypothetical protein
MLYKETHQSNYFLLIVLYSNSLGKWNRAQIGVRAEKTLILQSRPALLTDTVSASKDQLGFPMGANWTVPELT